MKLATAQQAIADDWTTAQEKLGLKGDRNDRSLSCRHSAVWRRPGMKWGGNGAEHGPSLQTPRVSLHGGKTLPLLPSSLELQFVKCRLSCLSPGVDLSRLPERPWKASAPGVLMCLQRVSLACRGLARIRWPRL